MHLGCMVGGVGMIKRYCDKCGQEATSTVINLIGGHIKTKEIYRRYISFVPAGGETYLQEEQELCEECMNGFYHWWSMGK